MLSMAGAKKMNVWAMLMIEKLKRVMTDFKGSFMLDAVSCGFGNSPLRLCNGRWTFLNIVKSAPDYVLCVRLKSCNELNWVINWSYLLTLRGCCRNSVSMRMRSLVLCQAFIFGWTPTRLQAHGKHFRRVFASEYLSFNIAAVGGGKQEAPTSSNGF